MSFRIETIHAFLAVGDDDEEGVIGINTMQGWVPFVAADQTRLDQLRPAAEMVARSCGKTVRLVRFSAREDIETIQ